MKKDFAFDQALVPKALAPVAVQELSPKLLGDLAHLFAVEADHVRVRLNKAAGPPSNSAKRAKLLDDYCWLEWIRGDLERRWRKTKR